MIQKSQISVYIAVGLLSLIMIFSLFLLSARYQLPLESSSLKSAPINAYLLDCTKQGVIDLLYYYGPESIYEGVGGIVHNCHEDISEKFNLVQGAIEFGEYMANVSDDGKTLSVGVSHPVVYQDDSRGESVFYFTVPLRSETIVETNSAGMIEATTVSSSDNRVSLIIPAGTRITRSATGEPVSNVLLEIQAVSGDDLRNRIGGTEYYFFPTGISFDPPITYLHKLDPEIISESADLSNMKLILDGEQISAIYNPITMTAEALIPHFTSSSLIAAGAIPLTATGGSRKFLWKPIAENGGKLVILHSFAKAPVQVYGPNGNLLETGRSHGASNGYGDTVRFSKPGSGYPANSIVKIGSISCLIKSPSSRITSCVAGSSGGDGFAIGGGDAVNCVPVGGKVSPYGIFSLESFNGKLYVGQYGRKNSMIYSYPPFKQELPGISVSESVCAFTVLGNSLIANTEERGEIYRSSDGSNWQKTYSSSSHAIGCAITTKGNTAYAIHSKADLNSARSNTLILASSDEGRTWRQAYTSGSRPYYLREIVVMGEKLYAFGYDVRKKATVMITSSDGQNWNAVSTPARFFRGHAYGQNEMILGSAKFNNVPAGIWKSDGNSFRRVYTERRGYVSGIEIVGNETYAITSSGWRARSGTSSLLHSPDGGNSWREICVFSEPEAWAVKEHNGSVYVGTRNEKGVGTLYMVTGNLSLARRGSGSCSCQDIDADTGGQCRAGTKNCDCHGGCHTYGSSCAGSVWNICG